MRAMLEGGKNMQIKSVTDEAFKKYGRVLKMEVPDLLGRLEKTPVTDGVEYVPSAPELEACAEYEAIQKSIFGGMPIQIGYCNGTNHTLNCVEYHRDSEINIALNGTIFLIGSQQDVEDDYTYDTSKMEAFEAPAGSVVELFATTLHYAPIDARGQDHFRVAVVLPKGTNTEPPVLSGLYEEDKLLTAKNKWLIAHEESNEGKGGAFVGLKGENLKI